MTGCADGLVRLFDTRTGQCIKLVCHQNLKEALMLIQIYVSSSLHGHTGSVEHVVLSGRTLVSAGSDWWAIIMYSEISLIWTQIDRIKCLC